MRGVKTLSGGFRGIPGGECDPEILRLAETQLQELLDQAGITPAPVYRPGEVCRLLKISPTTLRQLCTLAEHPAVRNPNPRALESFLVGCHHRIRHAALLSWLVRNQTFQRES